MKYHIEIDIQPRSPVIPLNLKIDEKTVREFKFVAKQIGVSMTHVLTKFLKEFVDENRSKNESRQRSLL
jgi:hypothetical protein